jgi:hypothetical protein
MLLPLNETLILAPGVWTPTGWGAQHQVRRVFATDPDGAANRIEMTCHSEGQSVAIERVNPLAADPKRCSRCELIPGLGPIGAPTLSEVRRDEQTGVVVACTKTWDDRVPTSPVDHAWLILDWGHQGRPAGSVPSRLDSYDVAAWAVVGTVPGMSGSA